MQKDTHLEWSRGDHGSYTGRPRGALGPLLDPGAHAPPPRSHRPFTLAPGTPGPTHAARPGRHPRLASAPHPLPGSRWIGANTCRVQGLQAARPQRNSRTPLFARAALKVKQFVMRRSVSLLSVLQDKNRPKLFVCISLGAPEEK